MTTTTSVLERIAATRIVPVITVEEVDAADGIAAALIAGGIGVAEITLRTEAGLRAIEQMRARDGILVGAGTVLTPEQVDQVADVGAEFVVSPGLDVEVVRRSAERGLLPIPGIGTASEAQTAIRLGLDFVKVFPAAQLGGAAFIDALSGPFPGLRYLPSGGVTLESAKQYLGRGAVLAVGGSWLTPGVAVRERRFTEIEAACRYTSAALAAVRRRMSE
jgi:2-dehydro-3-deoxyphosphogluconate aldolase/(4S)-4-hydroxy-2-oxoglutarate aldolase